MRLGLAAALLVLLAPAADAQPAEPGANLATVTLNFGEAGKSYRADLVASEDDADLEIRDLAAPDTPIFVKKNFVFSGPMAGQAARLEANSRGSLLIKSENIAVGLDKWEQTLTVVKRGGVFIVAGLSYTAINGRSPDAGGVCDVNFLTGKATRNGRAARGSYAPVPLADWSETKMPRPCKF